MRRSLVLILFLVLIPGAQAYIDTLVCPLGQFNGTFQVIAEGVVEKVDAGKKVCLLKIGKLLKGRTELTHVRLNVGAGQDGHPDVVMPHLVPGAPVMLWFYWGDGPKTAIYVNRFFLEGYRNQDGAPPDPTRVWWHFSSVATLYNRTFNGTVDELSALLPEMLAGKTKGPQPDPKLPPITRASLAALPVWGAPAEARTLPLCFRPRVRAGAPRAPDRNPGKLSGLAWKSFEGSWEALPEFQKLAPAGSGHGPGITLNVRPKESGYALQFSGFLEVPRAGAWTFTLASNDGARLTIGDTVLVDNDHFRSVIESSGEIALEAGRHAFRLEYFQHSGFQELALDWEGPERSRQRIPDAAFFRP